MVEAPLSLCSVNHRGNWAADWAEEGIEFFRCSSYNSCMEINKHSHFQRVPEGEGMLLHERNQERLSPEDAAISTYHEWVGALG